MASNTRTIQNTIDWAKFFVGNRPSVLGGANGLEPALTSANMVIQTFLQPPFKWRWNRNSVTFQSIDPVGWVAVKAVVTGYRIKDSNGNMQTVTTPGTTKTSTHPVWNTTAGGTTADGTAVWTMSFVTDYVQLLTDFGFIEKAQVTTAAGVVTEIPTIKLELTQDAGSGRPNAVGAYIDDNAGNITFRFMPGLQDQLYTINIIYQKKAVLLTAVTGATGTWPIPDEYSFVTNWGLLCYLYFFTGNSKLGVAHQQFVNGLLAISEGLDQQEKEIFREQWNGIIRSAMAAGTKFQEGNTSRSQQ